MAHRLSRSSPGARPHHLPPRLGGTGTLPATTLTRDHIQNDHVWYRHTVSNRRVSISGARDCRGALTEGTVSRPLPPDRTPPLPAIRAVRPDHDIQTHQRGLKRGLDRRTSPRSLFPSHVRDAELPHTVLFQPLVGIGGGVGHHLMLYLRHFLASRPSGATHEVCQRNGSIRMQLFERIFQGLNEVR